MKVILRADHGTLGKRGDIVDVADGHARNLLLPKGLAIVATDGAVTQAKAMRRARDLRDATEREGAQAIASKLVAKTISISAKAGPEGRLFGSVTSADIVAAVADQTGIELERRHVHTDPLKVVGTHQVSAKLHSSVEFPITVEILAK